MNKSQNDNLYNNVHVVDVNKTLIDNTLSSIVQIEPINIPQKSKNLYVDRLYLYDNASTKNIQKHDNLNISINDSGDIVHIGVSDLKKTIPYIEICPICNNTLFDMFDLFKTCITFSCMSNVYNRIYNYLQYFVEKGLLNLTLKEYNAINILIRRNVYIYPLSIVSLKIEDFISTGLSQKDAIYLLDKLKDLLLKLSFYDYIKILFSLYFSQQVLTDYYNFFYEQYLSNIGVDNFNKQILVTDSSNKIFKQFATILNHIPNKEYVYTDYMYKIFA